MKMDTTSWILLLALLFLLLRKSQAQTAATGAGSRVGLLPGGTPATAGKGNLLQQFFQGLTPTKTPAGGGGGVSGGGGGGGGGQAPKPSPSTPVISWRPPTRSPMQLLSSPQLTSLIPSQAPPVYNLPTMNYPGFDEMPTIPSDTSGLFVTPSDPMPIISSDLGSGGGYTMYDSSGNVVGSGGGLLPYEPPPVLDLPTMNYPGPDTTSSLPDPTYFSPVDTQTIDTSTLGGIAYLPDAPGGGDIFAAAGGDPGYGGGGTGDFNAGDYGSGSWDYADMAMSE